MNFTAVNESRGRQWSTERRSRPADKSQDTTVDEARAIEKFDVSQDTVSEKTRKSQNKEISHIPRDDSKRAPSAKKKKKKKKKKKTDDDFVDSFLSNPALMESVASLSSSVAGSPPFLQEDDMAKAQPNRSSTKYEEGAQVKRPHHRRKVKKRSHRHLHQTSSALHDERSGTPAPEMRTTSARSLSAGSVQQDGDPTLPPDIKEDVMRAPLSNAPREESTDNIGEEEDTSSYPLPDTEEDLEANNAITPSKLSPPQQAAPMKVPPMYALSQGARHQEEASDEDAPRPQGSARHQVSVITNKTSKTAAQNDQDRRHHHSRKHEKHKKKDQHDHRERHSASAPSKLSPPQQAAPVKDLPTKRHANQSSGTGVAYASPLDTKTWDEDQYSASSSGTGYKDFAPAEDSIAENLESSYQHNEDVFRQPPTPPPQTQPGAHAVIGPDAAAMPNILPQDDISRNDRPSQRQLVVAAEVAPGEEDIEAEINARVRQQTDEIADQVREQIIGEAVQADVIDSHPTRNKRFWIAGGVLALLVIGVVVALVIALVPRDNETTPAKASTPTSEPPPISPPMAPPTAPPTSELSSSISTLHARLSPVFGDLVSDQTTPQFVALQWLAESDPANLPVESTPLSTLQQRFIFAVLYFATNGESWTQQYNFLTETDVCSWNDGDDKGVTCDSIDHVYINLEENGLEGSFPPEITKLSALEVLDLRDNTISGTIPESIGDLGFLKSIDLSSNSMQGSIPTTLFNLPKLESIVLGANPDIGGTLPANIGSSSSLRRIALFGNSLSGPIPSSISELQSLETILIVYNLLTGTIPSFAKSAGLTVLFLNDLRLTGSIPQSIGDLPRLELFGAANNQLTGKVPSFAGNTGSISELWLYGNLLTGIGDFFQSAPTNALKLVQCHQNRFSDTFPTRIGEFISLRVLDLSENELKGTIPNEVGRLNIQLHESISTDEGRFDVRRNQLTGTIPTELGLLTMADRIDVGYNQLNGTIPHELGNCTNLNELVVSYNVLEGTVPTEIAALPLLQTFKVDGNDGITGDLDKFCARPTPFVELWSDCLRADVTCTCCHKCCESASISSPCEEMNVRN